MDRKMTIAGAASKRAACVEFLSGKYKAEGYEVQIVPIEENGEQGVLLQMRNTTENTASGWMKKLTGLETCASVKLVDAGTALSAEVLAGKWLCRSRVDGRPLAAFSHGLNWCDQTKGDA